MTSPKEDRAVGATKRRPMTKARRARILTRHGQRCARLGCEERQGLEIDHVIPLELGGKDDDANCEPLCPKHHAAKTRLDVRMIAKARRIRKRLAGEVRCKRPIRSRGFDKQPRPFPRHPTKKRTLSGAVVSRL